MFIKEPVENSDDFDFDDFEDLEEGPDLGFGEEPKSAWLLMCWTRESGEELSSLDARPASSHDIFVAWLSYLSAGPWVELLSV